MAETARLPVWATVKRAYGLLWDHRRLHAKAIWPPIVFLVAAEFIFHKTVGDARGLDGLENALSGASWYRLAAIGVLWLAGLKFLLSFSISWRRHVMLGEEFDPFFFKKPFWKYFTCVLALDLIFGALIVYPASFLYFLLAMSRFDGTVSSYVCLTFEVIASIYLIRVTVLIPETVPKFSAICVSDGKLTWRKSWGVMHGNVLRYLAIWLLVMLPVIAITQLLSLANEALGIDVAATPVALADSAFRQACLFLHFSLGASIGMMTYAALVQGRGPETIR